MSPGRTTLSQTQSIIVEFMDYYNNSRMHSSLNFLSFVEFQEVTVQ
ncbi:IS3 family transposase [Alicyclobacillus sp. SO9]